MLLQLSQFFPFGHPARSIKQSEMFATCPGLLQAQAKPGWEPRLAAASARPRAT